MFFLLDQIIDVLGQFFLVLRVFHDMFHLSKTTLDLNCFGLRILKAKVGKGFFELLQGLLDSAQSFIVVLNFSCLFFNFSI